MFVRAPGDRAGAEGVAMTKKKMATSCMRACCHARALVIRLLEYRRIPTSRGVSRKTFCCGDRNTCQYCSTTLPSGELTLDM